MENNEEGMDRLSKGNCPYCDTPLVVGLSYNMYCVSDNNCEFALKATTLSEVEKVLNN